MEELKNLTRRGGLITGAKLAFAAPAIVAGLRGGVAFADDGDHRSGDRATDEGEQRDTRTTEAVARDVSTKDVDTNGVDTHSDTHTGESTQTSTHTTTTVAGERVQAAVLGHARLCRVVNNEVGHAVVGQLRLVRASNGTHMAFRLRGGRDRVVTIADSPSDLFNGQTLSLKNDRAMLSDISDAQVSKLIVANTHDFATGFQFTVKDGDKTLTFVTCPDHH
jgi:hypothetical protein